ncbi:M55 family metallopeptidase [Evansella sp. LMS18]|jgi:D-amino peptidase|uniref:M55 family metallopeptidase n=1 Tax=Evansella sp. LMS18 TaxID=2924033 RepID=UPI0020D06DAF|nr:M55 family metallopeptidase [Evansella sp. LMS18]UTR09842.1 M55 family metallopeptidase [Evansella sp. LMS18]
MKVFISADMEGVAGVVHNEQTGRDGKEHDRARMLMTEEVNAAVEGALEAGAKEILVNDSHGTMRNLLPELLHEEAEYIIGTTKTLAMMEGIDESFDAAILLGYHARMGQDGILNHSYNGRIVNNIRINGVDYGEIGINAAIAGTYQVPVVLVTGCQYAGAEAKGLIPGIEAAEVKQTLTRYTAKNLTPGKSRKLIKQSVIQALEKRKEIKPYVIDGPYNVELTYVHSGYADAAEILPIVEKIDSVTHRFEADDFIQAFRYTISLVDIANAGV